MITKSYVPTKEDREEINWSLLDAKGKVLGRFAIEVVKKLLGKEEATYTPGVLSGNKVVVINAKDIKVTGGKLDKKMYYRHSDYPGALKKRTLKQVMKKDSTQPLRLAVKGMLPKNKLTKKYMANLYIYPDKNHPHRQQLGDN